MLVSTKLKRALDAARKWKYSWHVNDDCMLLRCPPCGLYFDPPVSRCPRCKGLATQPFYPGSEQQLAFEVEMASRRIKGTTHVPGIKGCASVLDVWEVREDRFLWYRLVGDDGIVMQGLIDPDSWEWIEFC